MNTPEYFAHESSFVDEPVDIGKDTKIWHFCHVMGGAKIGANCNIGQNVFVASKAVIGNRVKIQNNISVYDGVIIEDDVFCGPSMVFTNIRQPRCEFPKRDKYETTLVKRGTTIGANVTIVCGVTIGEYAFVGAGSVVSRDVAPYALVYGIPARLHGWVCECSEKLPSPASEEEPRTACNACGRQYVMERGCLRKESDR